MRNQKGMTLVELLVAGLLSVVTAGVVLTFFYMNTAETREGAANVSLERLYDVVSYNIGRNVRQGAAVLESGESFVSRNDYLAKSGVTRIETRDLGGKKTGGYTIHQGMLWEWDTTANKDIVFKSGKDTVRVEGGSTFSLESGRRAVSANLIFSKILSGKKYTLSSRGDLFRCRNADL